MSTTTGESTPSSEFLVERGIITSTPSPATKPLTSFLGSQPPSPSFAPSTPPQPLIPNAAATHPTSIKDEGHATGVPSTPAEAQLLLTRAKEKEEKDAWVRAYDAAQPSGRGLSVIDPDYQEIMCVWRAEQKAKREYEEKNGILPATGGAAGKKKKEKMARMFGGIGV